MILTKEMSFTGVMQNGSQQQPAFYRQLLVAVFSDAGEGWQLLHTSQ